MKALLGCPTYSKEDTEQSQSTYVSVFCDLDQVLHGDFEFVARHGGDNHCVQLSGELPHVFLISVHQTLTQ